MKGAASKLTAGDLTERLHAKFPSPDWASFTEVMDATGAGAAGRIDFLAISTWPSRGDRLVAVEVKVDRADFMREIANPNKRKFWVESASEFWFACPRGLVSKSEVPDGCGLFETWGDKLKVSLAARQSDMHLDFDFVRSIARRCANAVRDADRASEPFAEFAGKSVSIDDLRRLASKLHPRAAVHATDVLAEARRLRESDRASHRNFWDPRERAMEEAERLARLVDPSIRKWRIDPSKVAKALETISSVHGMSKLAEQLRSVADSIDAAGAGGAA